MIVKSILAISNDYVIGYHDNIPWKIKDDMKLFKSITMNNTLMLGSVTALGMMKNWPETVPFLSGRDVVILTTNKNKLIENIKKILSNKTLNVDNVHVIDTRTKTEVDVLTYIKTLNLKGDLYICGGSKVYESFIEFSKEIHLTSVETDVSSKFNKSDLTFFNSTLMKKVLSSYNINSSKQIDKSDDNEYSAVYYHLTQ